MGYLLTGTHGARIWGQWNSCYWVHPAGFGGDARAAASCLCTLPLCLPGHSRGQPQHPGSHLGGAQTPHPHVLLPGEPISAGHWVHHRHRSLDAGPSLVPQAHSSLCSLPHTAFLLPSAGWCGLLLVDSHGLWPIPGHLPTPHLQHLHEPDSPEDTGGCVLGLCLLKCTDPHCSHIHTQLLWSQCDQPLLLWPPTALPALLLQHSAQRAAALWSGCPHGRCTRDSHRHLLHPCGSCSPADPLSGGQEESLLHVWLPPHCGGHLLWHRRLQLHEARLSGGFGQGQGDWHPQHHHQSHAEPTHLQPPEPWCAGRPKEGVHGEASLCMRDISRGWNHSKCPCPS